jgi:sulfate transport system permease protein
VAVLVAAPLVVVAWRTVEQGAGQFWDTISSPQAVAAFRLTAVVAGSAVVLNVVFGVGVALLLSRYRFPGKRLLSPTTDSR